MRRLLLRPRWIILISAIALVVAVWFWWFSPEQQVTRLLRETRDQPAGKFSFSWSRSTDAIDADFQRLGASAVQPLIDALRDSDSHVRYLACRHLGLLKDHRAVEPLIASMDDPD